MAVKVAGLFFGSFNPIHSGHLMIANYLLEYWTLDQVWFVISPLNPFKAGQELLPDYHRHELLIRAIGDYPGFRISTIEFSLPKPSYTIDTLTFLKKKYPDIQFCLIMGSDQLRDFHKWKSPELILENHEILVYPRSGEQLDRQSETPEDKGQDPSGSGLSCNGSRVTSHDLTSHPSFRLVDAPLIEVSSTFIRRSIREGKDVRFFMPEPEWKYIDEMNFYR